VLKAQPGDEDERPGQQRDRAKHLVKAERGAMQPCGVSDVAAKGRKWQW